MSSEKRAESDAHTVQQTDIKCHRNYKPWIWVLVAMSLVTVAWGLYAGEKREEYVNNFLSRNT